MINRMPQPALVGFASHKTPHLIDLRGFHAPHFDRDRVRTTPLHDACVDLGEAGRFFLIPSAPYSDPTCRTRAISRIPLPLSVISTICCFTVGQTSRIRIVCRERPATLRAFADSESAPCHYWSCHTSRPLHSDNADTLRLPLPSPVPPAGPLLALFSSLNKWETLPLRNPPERQEGQGATKALSNWEGRGGMQTWCFTPAGLSGRVGLMERRHGLKPDWGELNVRNFRGGAGNVNEGRTRNPPHNRKSESRKLPA